MPFKAPADDEVIESPSPWKAPETDAVVSPAVDTGSDWLGVGEEVRGVGRSLERGGRRFVQELDVRAMRQGENAKDFTPEKPYAELKQEYEKAKAELSADKTSTQSQLSEKDIQLSKLGAKVVAARHAEYLKERAGRASKSFSKQAAAIEKLPQTQAQLEFSKAETPWWHFFKNPVELSTTTLAESAPTMATTMVAAPLGPFGVAAAAGLGSYEAESSARIVNAMSEAGVDLKKPEEVMAWFSSRAKSNPEIAKADLAALGPATFDALTGGLAGKFLGPAVGKGLRPVLTATGKEMGLQMAGGGAGSIAGNLIAQEPIDWKDFVLEVAGEFAPGEAISNVRAERARSKNQASRDFIKDKKPRESLYTTEAARAKIEDFQRLKLGGQNAVQKQGAETIPLQPAPANSEAVVEEVRQPTRPAGTSEETPQATPTVLGGGMSTKSPEEQAQSAKNNAVQEFAKANGVEWVEGDTNETILAKINAKKTPTIKPPEIDTKSIVQPSNLPTVPTGYVRLYHGGGGKVAGDNFTPSIDYATSYAAKSGKGGRIWYVDVPEDAPFLRRDEGAGNVLINKQVLPDAAADQAKPIEPKGGESNVRQGQEEAKKEVLKPEAKDPWQMTQSQYGDFLRREYPKGKLPNGQKITPESIAELHRASIWVVTQGPKNQRRDVAPEVFADYPDLKPLSPGGTATAQSNTATTVPTTGLAPSREEIGGRTGDVTPPKPAAPVNENVAKIEAELKEARAKRDDLDKQLNKVELELSQAEEADQDALVFKSSEIDDEINKLDRRISQLEDGLRPKEVPIEQREYTQEEAQEISLDRLIRGGFDFDQERGVWIPPAAKQEKQAKQEKVSEEKKEADRKAALPEDIRLLEEANAPTNIKTWSGEKYSSVIESLNKFAEKKKQEIVKFKARGARGKDIRVSLSVTQWSDGTWGYVYNWSNDWKSGGQPWRGQYQTKEEAILAGINDAIPRIEQEGRAYGLKNKQITGATKNSKVLVDELNKFKPIDPRADEKRIAELETALRTGRYKELPIGDRISATLREELSDLKEKQAEKNTADQVLKDYDTGFSDAMDEYYRNMSESVSQNPPERVSAEAEAASKGEVLTPEQAKARVESWRQAALAEGKTRKNSGKIILSLFDSTGVWSQPWRDAGYEVVQIDNKIVGGDGIEMDVMEVDQEWLNDNGLDMVHGVLVACPCTEFAGSGARWFKIKDADGRTEKAKELVHHSLAIVEYLAPDGFWAFENPVGRLKKETNIPTEALQFQPHNYGDPYTKRTQIFGNFNTDLPQANVEPTGGSYAFYLRGDVPDQKEARSKTFEGFAYSFFMANRNRSAEATVEEQIGKRPKEEVTLLGKPESWWTSENLNALSRDELNRIANSLAAKKTNKPTPLYVADILKRAKSRLEELRNKPASEEVVTETAKPDDSGTYAAQQIEKRFGVSRQQFADMANYNDFDQQKKFGTTRAKLMERLAMEEFSEKERPKKTEKSEPPLPKKSTQESELRSADDYAGKLSNIAEKAVQEWAVHVQDVVEPLKKKIRAIQMEVAEMSAAAQRTVTGKRKMSQKAVLAHYGVHSKEALNTLYQQKNAEWAALEKQLEAAEQKRKELEVVKDRRGKEWSSAATRAGELRRQVYPKVKEGDVGVVKKPETKPAPEPATPSAPTPEPETKAEKSRDELIREERERTIPALEEQLKDIARRRREVRAEFKGQKPISTMNRTTPRIARGQEFQRALDNLEFEEREVGRQLAKLREEQSAAITPKEAVEQSQARLEQAKNAEAKPGEVVTLNADNVQTSADIPAAKKKAGDVKFSGIVAREQKQFLSDAIDQAIADAPETRPAVNADADKQALAGVENYNKDDAGSKEKFEARRDAVVLPLFDKYDVPARMEAQAEVASQDPNNPMIKAEPAFDLTMESRIGILKSKIREARFEQSPKVRIEVPGDGTFNVVNSKAELRDFKENHAKRFPTTAGKANLPTLPNIEAKNVIKVGKLDAKAALSALEPIRSTDESRYIINYLFSDGKQSVATDGRRLFIVKMGLGGTEANPVILDAKTGKKAALKTKDDKFPNFKQVIPPESKEDYPVNTEQLITAIRRGQQMTTEKSNSIRLYRNKDGSFGITSNTPDLGEAAHNVTDDSKLLSAFNPEYLLDLLESHRKVGDEKLTLKFIDELSPIVLEGKNSKSVLMPMRLSSLGQRLKPGQGMSAAEVNAAIADEDTADFKVNVITADEAPEITGRDDSDSYGGFFYNGQVYLIATNINRGNVEAARQLLREEVGHGLLRTPQGLRLLNDVLNSGRLNLTDEEIQKLRDKGYTDGEFLDEFIAQSARENRTWWQELVAKVREWLANLGLVNLTNEETARILLKQVRRLREGEESFADAATSEGQTELPEIAKNLGEAEGESLTNKGAKSLAKPAKIDVDKIPREGEWYEVVPRGDKDPFGYGNADGKFFLTPDNRWIAVNEHDDAGREILTAIEKQPSGFLSDDWGNAALQLDYNWTRIVDQGDTLYIESSNRPTASQLRELKNTAIEYKKKLVQSLPYDPKRPQAKTERVLYDPDEAGLPDLAPGRSVPPEGEGEEPRRKREQVLGVRGLGAEYDPQAMGPIKENIRRQYFSAAAPVSADNTDRAFNIASQLVDPALRRTLADEVSAVIGENAEAALVLLRNELADYALKMASAKDPNLSLMRYMVENWGKFTSSIGGTTSAAGRELRAIQESQSYRLFKLLADQMAGAAKAAGTALKIDDITLDEIVEGLRNLKIDPNAEMPETRKRVRKQARDETEIEEAATNIIEKQAKAELDKLERDQTEWLKPEAKKNQVRELIKDFLAPKPNAGIPPAKLDFINEFAKRIRDLGGEYETGRRLGEEVWGRKEALNQAAMKRAMEQERGTLIGQAEAEAKRIADKIERTEFPGDTSKRQIVQETIRDFLTPKETDKGGFTIKSEPPLSDELTYKPLVDKLVEVGVTQETAERLALSIYNDRQTKWQDARLRAQKRAAERGSIRPLIEKIQETPYQAQKLKEWRLKTAEDWFKANGLSTDQAKAAAEAFNAEFEKKMVEAGEALAKRLLQNENPSSVQEIILGIRSGLLDPNKSWTDSIAQRSGWKPFSQEEFNKLAWLEMRSSNEALSPQEWASVEEQMMSMIGRHIPPDSPILKRVNESFVASLLSGIRTFAVQLSPVVQAIRDLGIAAVTSPGNFKMKADAMLQAYKNVLLPELKYAWQKDAYGFHLEAIDREHKLLKRRHEELNEEYAKANSLAKKASIRLKQIYTLQWNVSRLLSTMDQGMMATTREWKMALYASDALKQAGISTQDINRLTDSIAVARRTAYELAFEETKDATTAKVRANYTVGRAIQDFVADRTGKDSMAAQVIQAAENDMYSMVGRRAALSTKPGEQRVLRETDEGLLSQPANWIMESVSNLRGKGGLASLGTVAMAGFVNVPLRTARFASSFYGYGLLRYGINKFRLSKGKETFWKQSFANELQARQRLREAIASVAVTGAFVALAAIKNTADDDAGDDEFWLYVTGNGPTNKVLRDAWLKAGWKPYALNMVIGGKKVPIPLTRIGESLLWPAGIASAYDDAAWKRKEIAARGDEPPGQLSATMTSMVGTYAGMLGQKGPFQKARLILELMEGRQSFGKVATGLAASIASPILMPFKQLVQSVSDMFVGPLDQSSASAIIASNFPIVGLPFQQQAVNALGDPLYDRSWYGRLYQTGIPFAIQVSDGGENRKLYEAMVNKGVAPPEVRRFLLEDKFGPLTDEQFHEYALSSGRKLKDALSRNLSEIKSSAPEDAKKLMADESKQARSETADKLNLKPIKEPEPRSEAPAPPAPIRRRTPRRSSGFGRRTSVRSSRYYSARPRTVRKSLFAGRRRPSLFGGNRPRTTIAARRPRRRSSLYA